MTEEPTPDPPTATVLVVDDHALLVQSLAVALRDEGLRVETVDPDSHEAILAAAHACRPDVVLLDLDLGQGLDGTDLIAPLLTIGTQVLVVSGMEDRIRKAACVELGACDYLSKNTPVDLLVVAVFEATSLQSLLDEGQRQELLAELRAWRAEEARRHSGFRALTPREGQVLGALTEGLGAAEIARRSYVSEATVRTQIRAVLTKLGVSSQLAAVAEARQVGWTPEAALPRH